MYAPLLSEPQSLNKYEKGKNSFFALLREMTDELFDA